MGMIGYHSGEAAKNHGIFAQQSQTRAERER
jgi:hypothetical protein